MLTFRSRLLGELTSTSRSRVDRPWGNTTRLFQRARDTRHPFAGVARNACQRGRSSDGCGKQGLRIRQPYDRPLLGDGFDGHVAREQQSNRRVRVDRRKCERRIACTEDHVRPELATQLLVKGCFVSRSPSGCQTLPERVLDPVHGIVECQRELDVKAKILRHSTTPFFRPIRNTDATAASQRAARLHTRYGVPHRPALAHTGCTPNRAVTRHR